MKLIREKFITDCYQVYGRFTELKVGDRISAPVGNTFKIISIQEIKVDMNHYYIFFVIFKQYNVSARYFR